jgi:hypothetical protein
VAHLAPDLQARAATEAISAAREIASANSRAELLCHLAPELPPNFRSMALREIVATVKGIKRLSERTRVLETTASCWSGCIAQDRAGAAAAWSAILHILSMQPRPDLLSSLRKLMPPLLGLGGKEAAAQLALALFDTARWWP